MFTVPVITAGAAILLPPVFLFASVMLIMSIKAKRAPTYFALFTLNSKKSLAHQPLLWFSLGLPFLYFLMFGAIVWSRSDLELSAEGFENFLKISTMPLLLLSLALPFSLLIWRFHATLQTAEQIALASYKNNIDTYYAHKKALIDHFSSIPTRTYEGGIKAVFSLHPRLHLKFFDNTAPSEGIPNINNSAFEASINLLRTAQQAIYNMLTTGSDAQRISNYIKACDELYELAGVLVLEPIYGQLFQASVRKKYPECLKTSNDGRRNFRPMGASTHELIGAYRYCRSFLRLLCEFAGYEITFFEDRGRYDLVDKGRYYLPRSEERRVETFLPSLESDVFISEDFIEAPSVDQPDERKK